MKKILLMLVIFALIISVLSVVATPPPLLSGCNKFNSSAKDACVSEFAINSKDIKLCYVVKSQTIRDLCYTGVAKSLKSKSLCLNFPSSGRKQSDMQKVKDSCLLEVWKLSKDDSICKQIQSNVTRKECGKAKTSVPLTKGKFY